MIGTNSKLKKVSPYMNVAHHEDLAQLVARFQTNIVAGLSREQIISLQKIHGFNERIKKPNPSWIVRFLSHLAKPFSYISLVLAFIIFFIGDDNLNALIIAALILFNAILSAIKETKTYKVLGSLNQFAQEQCEVIRDGKKTVIAAKELVPGDIIIMRKGQRVPADAQIIEAHNLKVNESIFIERTQPVLETFDRLEECVPVTQKKNKVSAGSYIMGGWTKALVIATGMKTELNKMHDGIAQMHANISLAKQAQLIATWLLWTILGVCFLLLLLGFCEGRPFKELFVPLSAIFVCALPANVSVIISSVIAMGIYRMAQQKLLVKNMKAIEGLAYADTIILDKGGTLTRNEMVVSRVFTDSKEWTVSGKGYYKEGWVLYQGKHVRTEPGSDLHMLAQALSLLNPEALALNGDLARAALSIFSQKISTHTELHNHAYTKIYEIFSDAHPDYFAVFYARNGECIAFIQGWPEAILSRAKADLATDNAVQTFLDHGLNVIVVGMKKFSLGYAQDELGKKNQDRARYFEQLIESELTVLGVCGIEDSMRSEAAHTIAKARSAGFHIIMATADHQKTAISCAKEVGIYKDGDEAIDGAELDRLSDRQLKESIQHTTVFSRISPEHKLRIIQALHHHGLTVAVTGNSTNDVPSLLAADLGIGMSGIGTQLAKDSSDIILIDDSLVNSINAIEQARHTLLIMRRFILYFLSTHIALVLIILFALLLRFSAPYTPVLLPVTVAQIALLAVIAGFLASMLASEKKEKGVLFDQEWIYCKNSRLIDGHMLCQMMLSAVSIALGALFMFLLYKDINLTLARTMTCMMLGILLWVKAINCRSYNKSILELGLFTNRSLWYAAGLLLAVLFMVVYLPFLQKIFVTEPLNVYQWVFIGVMASGQLMLGEARKWVACRSKKIAHYEWLR